MPSKLSPSLFGSAMSELGGFEISQLVLVEEPFAMTPASLCRSRR
jgi:hypothetical protein